MKVVFLSDDFPPQSFGGAGISTFELARGVCAAGHDVFVITTCREASEAGMGEYEGLTVYRIKSSYPMRWRAWRSLYNPPVVRRVEQLLRELRPDVVHANNLHSFLSYHCLKVAKRHAKAVVWTARDAMAFSYGKLRTERYLTLLDAHLSWRDHLRQAGKSYNPLRNYLIKKYLGYADQRFAVSEALRRALEQNGIEDVEVFHTGIDPQAWEKDAASITKFKKKHGLEGKKIILFGGRLGAGAQVIAAMKLLAPEARDAVLLVMGTEEGAARMREERGDLPIIFTGWLSGIEKITAYGAADIVWVPSSYFDAFPRSALEASAAGRPVIATKFGGAQEIVQDGVTGYVINPLHAEEIVQKTLDLLQHPEKAEGFGQAGRERIESKFNLNNKVNQLLALYWHLLA